MLEPGEEFVLARRLRDQDDSGAAHRLVTSHLRLVAKIAIRYRGYGLPISEMVSEGNIGLMRAVERFDPDRGFRLSTYAMWWIRAAIQEYILRSWSVVKLGTTANQKKLFFNLRRAKARIRAFEEGDLTPDQVRLLGGSLGVPEQDVVEMNRRLGGDVSLNTRVREDGEEWQDWLADDTPSAEQQLIAEQEKRNRLAVLSDALRILQPRERQIFEARQLRDDPPTLDELSSEYGVSRERIRQIEARAFEKLRSLMTKGRRAPFLAQAA
jgi:RNA polymerase sigma-32 factor